MRGTVALLRRSLVRIVTSLDGMYQRGVDGEPLRAMVVGAQVACATVLVDVFAWQATAAPKPTSHGKLRVQPSVRGVCVDGDATGKARAGGSAGAGAGAGAGGGAGGASGGSDGGGGHEDDGSAFKAEVRAGDEGKATAKQQRGDTSMWLQSRLFAGGTLVDTAAENWDKLAHSPAAHSTATPTASTAQQSLFASLSASLPSPVPPSKPKLWRASLPIRAPPSEALFLRSLIKGAGSGGTLHRVLTAQVGGVCAPVWALGVHVVMVLHVFRVRFSCSGEIVARSARQSVALCA